LRDNVEKLVSEWDLEDPNPEEYTLILDNLARAVPGAEGRPAAGAGGVDTAVEAEGSPGADEEEGAPDASGGRSAPEDEEDGRPSPEASEEDGALRLIQMALEVEAWGLIVQSAVAELVEEGRVAELFELMAEARGSVTNGRIRKYITSPGQVRKLLGGEDVDEAALESVVEEMGADAVGPLMDALVDSDSRAVRRKVFDRLTAMEEDLHAEIRRRLEDSRWYVVRNMLALIQRLDSPPPEVDYTGFLAHPDHRVRREAFPLVLRHSASRTRTLATGLADGDERLNRIALAELRDGTPETLVPTLVNRIIRSDRPEDLRAMAARALEGSGSGLARSALLELVRAGRTLFGREKLAERSPAVVAALEVLARDWNEDPEVARVLAAARGSSDPALVRAASPGGGREA
ncbi:MAG: hypothetical protein ACOC8K_00850, partial [Gemmatimonadota bacterium]